MTRNDYQQGPWRLDDLFSAFDAPEVELTIERVEGLVATIEAARPDLSAEIDAGVFLRLLEKYEEVDKEISALFAFASLSFAAATQDQDAQAYLARFRQLAAETHNRILFFELWWKGLEDAPAERLMAGSGDFHYWLEALRLERPYTLSEAEERVINLRVFKNGPFTAGAGLGFVFGLTLFGSMFVQPLFLQHLRGYPVFDSALILMPRAGVMVFLAPIAGRLYNYVDSRLLIGAGIAAMLVGYYDMAHFNLDVGGRIRPGTNRPHDLLQVGGIDVFFHHHHIAVHIAGGLTLGGNGRRLA